jgi:anti-sigma factor RsiW
MNPPDRIHSPQDEDRLLQYLDGQLPVAEAPAIEMHLALCPECQALRRQWEQLDQQLGRALPRPRLSPEFAARLQRQIAMEVKASAPGARLRESGEAVVQSHQAWIEDQRRITRVLWLGLLDGVGYGALAAIGGYCVLRLILAWAAGPAGTGTALPGSTGFLFALVVAGATLLFGVNLAARNRVLRWLGVV